MAKYVYPFGAGKADGKADMKNLLGGKGANLAEMTNIGLPVPAGYTITTEVCTYYYAHNNQYPPELRAEADAALAKIESIMGAKFGDPANPLLVSCRSGARVSMPGMMDTVLNIGLNEKTVRGLVERTRNERFAWDSYRRFVQMYGDVVLGLKPQSKHEIDPFEHILDEMKHAKKYKLDTDLKVDDLKELVRLFKKAIKERTGKDFPEDPQQQLWGAIGAVFSSWMNDRAVVYRRQYGYPHDWGTAANVQAMVFGNMGDDCCTGVAFTRDPATGERVFYGEYLINAQGEDVVAGIRSPKKIAELKKEMPAIYEQLEQIRGTLEKHYREMQDIEFTAQSNKLYMLQTRNGKRTGFAAIRIAVDMVEEKLISKEEALHRVEPDALNQLLQPIFDPEAKRKAVAEGRKLATGINAGPGAASGKICLHASDAEELGHKGEKVILVRRETSPEDIRGMQAAQGILTAFGGASSHAALVSRQMGKVCIVGCGMLNIDYAKGTVAVGERVLKEGDAISIDGFTGEVIAGQVATRPSEVIQVLIEKSLKPEQSRVYQQFAELMGWADAKRKLRVRTNADQPDQAEAAVAFGAEGIGLCRTEHMFFEGNRIDAMREMILATTTEARKKALAKLLPYQREDFEGIFKAMKGMPVTIRTLDPPLHEFLPHNKADQEELAAKIGVSVDKIAQRVGELHEFNPMLGHRGCRLGITYPEITEMQCRAIFEAACNVAKASPGRKPAEVVDPEIMIPLVGFPAEFKAQARLVHETAKQVFAEKGVSVEYKVGTMVEVPRACAAADQIAKDAEFFSFGTNDLTQTTLGMSRDDYGNYIRVYMEGDIIGRDPFQSIDVDGVGKLMQLAVQAGRGVRGNLKVGICGEHGGDPDSVKFCHKLGLDYVSCSPFRVPIARLAAAQAALK
jgi:pyruvate,orthophosphate dikinase